jgi:hypothetical protein
MSHTTCVSPVSDGLRSPCWSRQTFGVKSFKAYCVSPVSACPAASRAQMRAQISLPACWFTSASMTVRSDARRAREHLIRSSGHIIQDGPLPSVRWAGIPQLSISGGRCLPSWQQYWQQSRRDGPDHWRPARHCAGDGPRPGRAGSGHRGGILPSGRFAGASEEALDCTCGLCLTESGASLPLTITDGLTGTPTSPPS